MFLKISQSRKDSSYLHCTVREGGRERDGKGGKKEGEGNGEGGGMKEDCYERKKTSKKERTPLTFLLGGCFDGGEAKKTKNGEEKKHTLQEVRRSKGRSGRNGCNSQHSWTKNEEFLHI